MRFQPEAAATQATSEVGYTVPIPLLGKLTEAAVVELNENEMDLVMANLKDRMVA